MKINQILGTFKFPISIYVEKENFKETFYSIEEIGNRFKEYRVENIASKSNIIEVSLVKNKTLEELGFSFESGV